MAAGILALGVGAAGPHQLLEGKFPTSALAADGLSASQTAAIQSAIQTALANIDPSLTGAARTQAIQTALSQAAKSAITTYGADAIAAVVQAAIGAGIPATTVLATVLPAATSTGVSVSEAVADSVIAAVEAGASALEAASTVIALSGTSAMPAADVGNGLGIAAAILEKRNNKLAALQIGQAIANEGTSDMATTFASAVLENGGTQDVADAGTGNPVGVTAETNTSGAPDDTTTGTTGTAGTSLPPCANPSCT
ncbi:MAG: hypothetical protein HY243_17510 [Proteobacteria bacterium]|nr:hypothetical protein [Pseudomonadota bacterium]